LLPAFSAAVHIQRNYKPYQEYFHWFRDKVHSHHHFIAMCAEFLVASIQSGHSHSTHTQKLQMAQVDRLAKVHGETLFHSFIYNHTKQKMFAVFFRGEVTTCFTKVCHIHVLIFALSQGED
jgi:hypothetical protein